MNNSVDIKNGFHINGNKHLVNGVENLKIYENKKNNLENGYNFEEDKIINGKDFQNGIKKLNKKNSQTPLHLENGTTIAADLASVANHENL